ncbi:hypothetical protein D5952_14005 [Salmonella enterica subsp. enterica]|nr:hypothetical protein [Salmonella enterica subsp. enterica serovar Bonn]EBZ5939293.1 hypothetical protein [Salmonella enterica subsp. enterica serovar Muenchen]MLZ41037.1 hypothetical protein [Salmonella enterica subsp. enterica serovar Bonn]
MTIIYNTAQQNPALNLAYSQENIPNHEDSSKLIKQLLKPSYQAIEKESNGETIRLLPLVVDKDNMHNFRYLNEPKIKGFPQFLIMENRGSIENRLSGGGHLIADFVTVENKNGGISTLPGVPGDGHIIRKFVGDDKPNLGSWSDTKTMLPSDKQSNVGEHKHNVDISATHNKFSFSKEKAILFAGMATSIVGLVRLIKDTIDLCNKVQDAENYEEIGEDSADRAVNDKIAADEKLYVDTLNNGTPDEIATIKAEMDEKYYSSPNGDINFSASYVKAEYKEGELSDIASAAHARGIESAMKTAKDINKSDFAADFTITGLGLTMVGGTLAYSGLKNKAEGKTANDSANFGKSEITSSPSATRFESLKNDTFNKSAIHE